MDRLQYVDGVGMIDKFTGMVAPLRTADGMPYMSPKQRKEEADAAKQEQAREAQRRFALQNAKTQMTSLGNALSMIPEPGSGVSWDTGFTGSVLSMLPALLSLSETMMFRVSAMPPVLPCPSETMMCLVLLNYQVQPTHLDLPVLPLSH